MENKTNIAELLKDYPKGMELDCVIFNDVTLDRIDTSSENEYPIRIETKNGTFLDLTKYGTYSNIEEAKCVIFPKGKTTWDGFVPPCKFKDGDIIADGYFNTICIFKGEGGLKGTVDFYCGIDEDDEFCIKNVRDPDEHFGEINEYNFATEEEKAKLFDIIKANGYQWNTETKNLDKLDGPKFKVGNRVKSIYNYFQYDIKELTDTHYTLVEVGGKLKYTVPISADKNWELIKHKFKVGDRIIHKESGVYCNIGEYVESFKGYNTNIGGLIIRYGDIDNWELYPLPNKFDITTFKPFDKVLVRLTKDGVWNATFFSHYDKEVKWGCYPFVTTSSKSYSMCIPYEHNEHLCGTTNDCDEFYKTWK